MLKCKAVNGFRLILSHFKVVEKEKRLMEKEKNRFLFKMKVTLMKIGRRRIQLRTEMEKDKKSCEQENNLEI